MPKLRVTGTDDTRLVYPQLPHRLLRRRVLLRLPLDFALATAAAAGTALSRTAAVLWLFWSLAQDRCFSLYRPAGAVQ